MMKLIGYQTDSCNRLLNLQTWKITIFRDVMIYETNDYFISNVNDETEAPIRRLLSQGKIITEDQAVEDKNNESSSGRNRQKNSSNTF